jgi:hypothetical protein
VKQIPVSFIDMGSFLGKTISVLLLVRGKHALFFDYRS